MFSSEETAGECSESLKNRILETLACHWQESLWKTKAILPTFANQISRGSLHVHVTQIRVSKCHKMVFLGMMICWKDIVVTV